MIEKPFLTNFLLHSSLTRCYLQMITAWRGEIRAYCYCHCCLFVCFPVERHGMCQSHSGQGPSPGGVSQHKLDSKIVVF